MDVLDPTLLNDSATRWTHWSAEKKGGKSPLLIRDSMFCTGVWRHCSFLMNCTWIISFFLPSPFKQTWFRWAKLLSRVLRRTGRQYLILTICGQLPKHHEMVITFLCTRDPHRSVRSPCSLCHHENSSRFSIRWCQGKSLMCVDFQLHVEQPSLVLLCRWYLIKKPRRMSQRVPSGR